MLGDVNTVYRIEHPSTGEGMYSNWGMHKYGTELYEMHDALRNRLNRDNSDFTLPPGKDIAVMFGYDYLHELEVLDEKELPTGAKEIIEEYNKYRYKDSTKYACNSLKCLSQWIYSELNLNELIELGFKLVAYEVPAQYCLELKYQILYNDTKVIKKHTLSMKSLLLHLLPIRENNKLRIEEEVSKLINNTDSYDRHNIKITIQPSNYSFSKWVSNVKESILNKFEVPNPPKIKGCILEKVLNP